MTAQYLVVQPPGAPIPDVGFVATGESFHSPSGYVPSRTFKALNVEAATELGKLKEKLKAEAKKSMEEAKEQDIPKERKEALVQRSKDLDKMAAEVDTSVIEIREAPKPEEKLSLGQLEDVLHGRSSEGGKKQRASDQK